MIFESYVENKSDLYKNIIDHLYLVYLLYYYCLD